MELQDIAAVSGKPGLYRILKPTRNGVILEALDASKAKFVANASSRVSILKDISIYTTTSEGSLPLGEVLLADFKIAKGPSSVTAKSPESEVVAFFGQAAPDFDAERVYLSDMKKFVSWYNLLVQYAPDKFEEKKEEAPLANTEVAVEESKSKAKSKTTAKSESTEPSAEKKVKSAPKAKSAKKAD
jgi:hypothetical protein